jgi:PAS domain S-box-containing protein
MLRIKLLRNLLLISLTIAILLPLYQAVLVHPSYNKLLTKETENEAVRYASYMVRTLGLENKILTRDQLPEDLNVSLQPVGRDKRLIKLRIFSTSGEIIFSTKADEIGRVNSKTYFHEIVANGRVYSKVVQKDRDSAEGEQFKIDVVETYVPFMAGDTFGGAFEVYYDVTESVHNVKMVSQHSMTMIVLMSIGFMAAIYIALSRACLSFQERDAAEQALQRANEDLEQRVEERTRELSSANEQLTTHIAERTKAQLALGQALEESRLDREKLDGILFSVPDGVVVMDNSLRVLHMNNAAEMILGTPLEDALGQSVAVLSSDVDLVKKVGQRLNVAHAARSFDFELAEGEAQSPRVYQARISQLISEKTVASGVMLLIRDVTRERDIERMKSAFLGMATHELNTPLTTIIGYTEILTDKETAGSFSVQQQQGYLQLIHDKAMSLAALVDDLLDISRIESGSELTLNYRKFDLNDMIRDVVRFSKEEIGEHQLETVLPESPVQFFADQMRMEQVLNHLISNAIKYSPDGGRVQIELVAQDEKCELYVEDEGIGMNEEQLEHIFDRFYRADSSDSAVQGVGLGMSIVRHVVLAHHGEIHVESQPGNGTRVSITLPMIPSVDFAEGRQPFAS